MHTHVCARKTNEQGDGGGRCTEEPLVGPCLLEFTIFRRANPENPARTCEAVSSALLPWARAVLGSCSSRSLQLSCSEHLPHPALWEGLARVTRDLGVTRSNGRALLRETPSPLPGCHGAGSPARPDRGTRAVRPVSASSLRVYTRLLGELTGSRALTTIHTLTSPRLIGSTECRCGAVES